MTNTLAGCCLKRQAERRGNLKKPGLAGSAARIQCSWSWPQLLGQGPSQGHLPWGQPRRSTLRGDHFGVCQEHYSEILGYFLSPHCEHCDGGWVGSGVGGALPRLHGPRFRCCCLHRELAHRWRAMLVCVCASVCVHVGGRRGKRACQALLRTQVKGASGSQVCRLLSAGVVHVSLFLFPSFTSLTTSPCLWSP